MTNRISRGVLRTARTAGLAALLFGSMGASCAPRAGVPFSFGGGPQAPVVLTAASTAADIVAAVNANTGRVQTYQASRATISMPGTIGLPLLSSSIAVERPQRLRLRATTTITGPEVDIGSNDERFWVWARRNEPPGVYTATHEAFRTSAAGQRLPIDPAWLVDALGLPTLDPTAAYQGPFPRGDGTVEIRAQSSTPSGTATRVYLIDDRTAQVREQQLYDAAGSLVASVRLDRHRFDPIAGVSLPEEVELQVPATQLSLRINTGPIVVNAPLADGGQLWQMPQLNGYPVVDLAGAEAVLSGRGTEMWNLAATPAQQPPAIAQSFGAQPVGGQPNAPASTVSITPSANPPSGNAGGQRAYGRIPASGVAIDLSR